ncbi:MAG: Ku protein [Gammaproteobacteria bacterium]|jgi:DNA end-binding protein Ku|nr:Ku protein [Gammaproteobacteria bacterium]
MPRPIWKGHISFGLVNIPVTLYSAEHRADLHFRMLDSRNKAKVHYERINEETGEEVPWDQIVKAYEFDKGNYVVLEKEDFQKAAPEQTKTINIECFIDQQEVQPIYFEKPYYLIPDKQAVKSYVLLREALKNTCKVGIASVVIHTREHLAAIMPYQNGILLELLRFEQEIRPIEAFDIPKAKKEHYRIQEKELELASQLINSMTEDWQPKRYHDSYRDTLMKWIQEKAAGKKAPSPKKEKTAKKAQVLDLMGLMKQSLQKELKKAPSKKSSPRKETA